MPSEGKGQEFESLRARHSADSRQHPILSMATFHASVASRSDEEHWELIAGVPVMPALPEFCLACPVKDIYRDTPLG